MPAEKVIHLVTGQDLIPSLSSGPPILASLQLDLTKVGVGVGGSSLLRPSGSKFMFISGGPTLLVRRPYDESSVSGALAEQAL